MNSIVRTAAALSYCAAGGAAAALAGARVATEFDGASAWAACLTVGAALTAALAALAARWNRPQHSGADVQPAASTEDHDFRESIALGFTEDLDAFTRRLDEATRKDT